MLTTKHMQTLIHLTLYSGNKYLEQHEDQTDTNNNIYRDCWVASNELYEYVVTSGKVTLEDCM